MRLLVSHQLLREEYMRTSGLSHYLIIVEVMHLPVYTETSNIKLLMLLVVCVLLIKQTSLAAAAADYGS